MAQNWEKVKGKERERECVCIIRMDVAYLYIYKRLQCISAGGILDLLGKKEENNMAGKGL